MPTPNKCHSKRLPQLKWLENQLYTLHTYRFVWFKRLHCFKEKHVFLLFSRCFCMKKKKYLDETWEDLCVNQKELFLLFFVISKQDGASSEVMQILGGCYWISLGTCLLTSMYVWGNVKIIVQHFKSFLPFFFQQNWKWFC